MFVGRGGVGLCLCRQRGRLASPREMGLSGSGLCRSWQEGPQPIWLGMSWQWEQPASAGECAAVLCFQKNSFGLLCFLPLKLQQMSSVCCCRNRSASRANAKPEAWGSSVGWKHLSPKYPFLHVKNLSLHLPPCKDDDNVWSLQ